MKSYNTKCATEFTCVDSRIISSKIKYYTIKYCEVKTNTTKNVVYR